MTPNYCCYVARSAQPYGRAWIGLPSPEKCQRGESPMIADGLEYRNCTCGSTIAMDLEDHR